MKVPPKRKGNLLHSGAAKLYRGTLNESPSEKEGKFSTKPRKKRRANPSMKVPPKRKGNAKLFDLTPPSSLHPQ